MIIAIDCDLRSSYCVSDDGRSGRGLSPFDAMDAMGRAQCLEIPSTILFEIASPVSFNRGAAGHAAMTQLAKWAIWNTAQAMRLHMFLRHGFPGCRFLVSPSNTWTKGYDLKTRHAMAKCVQPKKDLRECEAMIWFFKHEPLDWKPLPDYLAAL